MGCLSRLMNRCQHIVIHLHLLGSSLMPSFCLRISPHCTAFGRPVHSRSPGLGHISDSAAFDPRWFQGGLVRCLLSIPLLACVRCVLISDSVAGLGRRLQRCAAVIVHRSESVPLARLTSVALTLAVSGLCLSAVSAVNAFCPPRSTPCVLFGGIPSTAHTLGSSRVGCLHGNVGSSAQSVLLAPCVYSVIDQHGLLHTSVLALRVSVLCLQDFKRLGDQRRFRERGRAW